MLKLKYKIGDKIFIKENLVNTFKSDPGNTGFGVNDMMLNYCGKFAIIENVIWFDGFGRYGYKINLDSKTWNWDDEMIEGIKEMRKKKIIKIKWAN